MDDSKNTENALELATFAGGCFWCMEPPFESEDGVIATRVGYTGGDVDRPSYNQVCGGGTGHLEAVELIYDPKRIDYKTLLAIFWRNIDPTQNNGQFADHGPQYQTAIFYHNEPQRLSAQESKDELAASGRFDSPIVTAILPAKTFYPAEDEHQHFAEKNPRHYQRYRYGSGRGQYIETTWSEQEDH